MSLVNLSALSLAEIVGDFGFKNVARTGSLTGWTAGIGGYVAIAYFLIRSLRLGNVMYVNGMWDGISAVLETIAAYILFGERLNTWNQYLGLGVIIIGIFILHSGGIAH